MRNLWLIALALGSWSARGDSPSEIELRIKWWEKNYPQYGPRTDNGPVVNSPSVTARNAVDRTGSEGDALAQAFVKRGYFLLGALETKREMAPLTRSEILAFQTAVRFTRIEFVDTELFDNAGKRVVAVTVPDPTDRAYKLIRVYREDWTESERLGVDLVRLVFHEYLRVIGKDDDNYVTSIQLLVTERDFQKRRVASPECLSGVRKRAHLSLNLSLNFPYLRYPSYINGAAFDSEVATSFRVFTSPWQCTSSASRFVVSIGNFSKTIYLFGGDSITVFAPSGSEVYQPGS